MNDKKPDELIEEKSQTTLENVIDIFVSLLCTGGVFYVFSHGVSLWYSYQYGFCFVVLAGLVVAASAMIVLAVAGKEKPEKKYCAIQGISMLVLAGLLFMNSGAWYDAVPILYEYPEEVDEAYELAFPIHSLIGNEEGLEINGHCLEVESIRVFEMPEGYEPRAFFWVSSISIAAENITIEPDNPMTITVNNDGEFNISCMENYTYTESYSACIFIDNETIEEILAQNTEYAEGSVALEIGIGKRGEENIS